MLRGAGVQWSAAALRGRDCVRLGFRLRGGVDGYDLGLRTRNGSIDRVRECRVEDGVFAQDNGTNGVRGSNVYPFE